MTKLTLTKLKKFADKAKISISDDVGSPPLTMEQLALFAANVQADCAATCLKIAEKHQKIEGSRASAMKAGALECHAAMKA